MDAPRLLSVKTLGGMRLLAQFTNGVHKVYECKQLLRFPAFRLLTNDAFFQQVKVDAGGYGISWSDSVDLSEYEIWTNGVECTPAG